MLRSGDFHVCMLMSNNVNGIVQTYVHMSTTFVYVCTPINLCACVHNFVDE